MQFEQLKKIVLHRLETELAPTLFYHNAQHTINVLSASEKLAETENIAGDDLILLKTAALLHDIGFLDTYFEHERSSCEIARLILQNYEYSAAQIDDICEMIMATQLPQSPKNELSEVLCDADLYYIGTNEYQKYANGLFSELKAYGIIKTEAEWFQRQQEFLSSHQYFSKSAVMKLETTKRKNLDNL